MAGFPQTLVIAPVICQQHHIIYLASFNILTKPPRRATSSCEFTPVFQTLLRFQRKELAYGYVSPPGDQIALYSLKSITLKECTWK